MEVIDTAKDGCTSSSLAGGWATPCVINQPGVIVMTNVAKAVASFGDTTDTERMLTELAILRRPLEFTVIIRAFR